MRHMVLKNVKEGWGHSSVVEALAGQAWGQKLDPQNPHTGMASHLFFQGSSEHANQQN